MHGSESTGTFTASAAYLVVALLPALLAQADLLLGLKHDVEQVSLLLHRVPYLALERLCCLSQLHHQRSNGHYMPKLSFTALSMYEIRYKTPAKDLN